MLRDRWSLPLVSNGKRQVVRMNKESPLISGGECQSEDTLECSSHVFCIKENAMLDLSKRRDVHIDERLRSEAMMWLSTVRPNGRPHIVPVWFLWDGETILIFSRPDTQKLRNLRQNDHVMLALDTARLGGDIVTIEGKATLLEGTTLGMNMPVFAEKYAELIARLGQTPDSLTRMYSEVIQVTPTKFFCLLANYLFEVDDIEWKERSRLKVREMRDVGKRREGLK